MSVEFLQPSTWDDALAAKTAYPEAVPIAGGTDVMVEVNFDRRRPAALLDLTRVTELAEWTSDGGEGSSGSGGGTIRLGAGVSYRRVIEELGERLPGLAMASRTVGSPQIRNRGTVGGNLGSASPAGDAHPPLLAVGAEVELASTRGTRRVPVDAFFTGPKRSVLAADELIAAVHVPVTAGPEQFAKVGTRNAMVIAVCSFALAIDPEERRVGTCIGSAGPTPIVATEAEAFAAGELDWDGGTTPGDAALARFGELVAQAASPIDDVRGNAAYRRHALGVLARRELAWAWSER
ncbi:MAG TPA: FAD binding domain-containing protein [Micromonosporaceae bacterium]|nr:FAD binding domain-containing protein [Micromonosporaceae bacterium]